MNAKKTSAEVREKLHFLCCSAFHNIMESVIKFLRPCTPFIFQNNAMLNEVSKFYSKGSPIHNFEVHMKNIARVRNCPDVTILNSLLALCLLSFCLFVFLSFCLDSCWSNVWKVSSLKSRSLCQNSKVAVSHWPTDQG